jgi:ribosomal protein S18 acetylase RimI-like enzyme
MTDRTIREATSNDRDSIVRLLRQIASAAERATSDAEPTDDQLMHIVRGCKVFVLEQEGAVVGMNALYLSRLSHRPEQPGFRAAFIMAVGVDEGCRRQGLGRMLMEHMWRWLEEEQVKLVTLNVAAQNDVAQLFYKNMGFEIDTLHMAKWLSPPGQKHR